MWEMIPKELDETDMKIIHALRKNGRISMTELGKEVFMTSQAVKNRIARLQDLGVVERYTVNVNCPLFGYTIHCVFELVTDEKTREGFLEFMKHTEYHIFHCYRVDGAYRFFLDAHFHIRRQQVRQLFLDTLHIAGLAIFLGLLACQAELCTDLFDQ